MATEWQVVVKWDDGMRTVVSAQSREQAEAIAADPWWKFPGLAHPNADGSFKTTFPGYCWVESREVGRWTEVGERPSIPGSPGIEAAPTGWRYKLRTEGDPMTTDNDGSPSESGVRRA